MKTKDLIQEILKDQGELASWEITDEMKKRGYYRCGDTLARNLKSMTEKGILSREAKGKPWYYYYQLNK